MLDDDYVRTTCQPGQREKTCRYLLCGPRGWECGKLDAAIAAVLDRRVAEGTIVACGDNCEGRDG
jgi:hypothetical protein